MGKDVKEPCSDQWIISSGMIHVGHCFIIFCSSIRWWICQWYIMRAAFRLFQLNGIGMRYYFHRIVSPADGMGLFSARYVKLGVAHAPGMPGTFSPSPRVSDPDMLNGTRVTHVPCCTPGSLTAVSSKDGAIMPWHATMFVANVGGNWPPF